MREEKERKRERGERGESERERETERTERGDTPTYVWRFCHGAAGAVGFGCRAPSAAACGDGPAGKAMALVSICDCIVGMIMHKNRDNVMVVTCAA